MDELTMATLWKADTAVTQQKPPRQSMEWHPKEVKNETETTIYCWETSLAMYIGKAQGQPGYARRGIDSTPKKQVRKKRKLL